MSDKKRKADCTHKDRKCAACRAAVDMRPRPVWTTDAGDDVDYWRGLGAERIAKLTLARSPEINPDG